MKSPMLFALVAISLSAAAFAAQPALDCDLSIYALGADQSSLGTRIIGPDQVVLARYGKSQIVAGGTVLQVHLTASGAAANREFSEKNIGKKMAILCNGKVLSRPTIAGQSGTTFVIEGVELP